MSFWIFFCAWHWSFVLTRLVKRTHKRCVFHSLVSIGLRCPVFASTRFVVAVLIFQIKWFLQLLHLAVNDPKHDKTLKMLQPLAMKVQPVAIVTSESQSRATSSTKSSRARSITSPVALLASPLAAATAAAAAAVDSMRGSSRPRSAQSSRCAARQRQPPVR